MHEPHGPTKLNKFYFSHAMGSIPRLKSVFFFRYAAGFQTLPVGVLQLAKELRQCQCEWSRVLQGATNAETHWGKWRQRLSAVAFWHQETENHWLLKFTHIACNPVVENVWSLSQFFCWKQHLFSSAVKLPLSANVRRKDAASKKET